MFSSKLFRSTQPQENYNPETVFSKMLLIPHDQPIKECRMFLQTMREECKFQKLMIRKTQDMTVPIFRKQERQKLENFQNYQKLLKYSKKKQAKADFYHQMSGKTKIKVKKNRVQSLRQIIDQKKTKMLTQNSKQQFEDRQVENMLKDDRLRSNLFDQSILIERLNEIKKKLKEKEQVMYTVPNKFKGLNPQHLKSLQQQHAQKNYNRRKYVNNRTKFQFFKSAIKAQQNLLKTKQKQSKLVISNLMNNFSDQILTDDDIRPKINRCIHRLFLKYANSDSENIGNMYKIIKKDKIITFFEDFNIKYMGNDKIEKIINEIEISQFQFLQIMHLLSLKQGNQFQGNVYQFLQKNVLNHPEIYLPLEWTLYQKNIKFITKYLKLKRFKQKLQLIYQTFIKRKRIRSNNYNFDDMVEVMWMLKIYPFMINKKKLRFYYLYTQNEESGVSIQDIMDIYMYIAISRQGNLEQNIAEIVRNVLQFSKTQKPI